MSSSGAKKILVLGGDFVEDYEIMVPYQMLQLLGYEVDVVCPDKKAGDKIKTAVHDFEGDQTYTEKRGHNFVLTKTFDDVKVAEYAGLYVPGGRSPEYLRLNSKVVDIVKYFFANNKPVAAICHGIQLVAAAGVLTNTCTAYPACKLDIVSTGGKWVDSNDKFTNAFTDGNLVTAGAWPAHADFIRQFSHLLGTRITH